MSQINTILFDLDGVLVDACDWHYESLNRALIEVGFPAIPYETHMKEFNGLPTKVKLDKLSKQGLTAKQCKDVWRLKQFYTTQVIKETASYDVSKVRMHQWLVDNDYILGCVTNSIYETANLMLEMTGQRHFMSIVVTNEDVVRNKPDPDCYLYAMNRLGVQSERVMIVEDSDRGYQAAKAANPKMLWKVTNASIVDLYNLQRALGIKW